MRGGIAGADRAGAAGGLALRMGGGARFGGGGAAFGGGGAWAAGRGGTGAVGFAGTALAGGTPAFGIEGGLPRVGGFAAHLRFSCIPMEKQIQAHQDDSVLLASASASRQQTGRLVEEALRWMAKRARSERKEQPRLQRVLWGSPRPLSEHCDHWCPPS